MKRAAVPLALLVSFCTPSPVGPTQVLLHVDTDAIVPGGVAVPLFDRLRIDVLQPGATLPCSACTTDVSLSVAQLRAGDLSVGIPVTPDSDGYRVRLRLFYGALVDATDVPVPAISVDTALALPRVDAGNTQDVTVVLLTDTLGSPQGTTDEPIKAIAGRPSSSVVSTWPGGRRVDCAATPEPGEVCVPGGAFWMGDPRVFQLDGAIPPHLVVLSPFFLDAAETTVQAYRSYGSAVKWSGDPTGQALADYCTFTASGPTHANLPVNCMNQAAALAYCNQRGADLPSEAQFEYVQSALGSSSFVWGEDPPGCADAAYARGGWQTTTATDASDCKPAAAMDFVLPAGSTLRDHLALDTGTLDDLAGDVSEWAKDTWQTDSESCWSATGVLTDPVCADTSTLFPPSPAYGRQWVVRGGSWSQSAAGLQAAFRIKWSEGDPSPKIGFRCARPGT